MGTARLMTAWWIICTAHSIRVRAEVAVVSVLLACTIAWFLWTAYAVVAKAVTRAYSAPVSTETILSSTGSTEPLRRHQR